MANFHKLQIYHLGQQQLRDVAVASDGVKFGDLANQLRRSAISVVSNLVEGAGRGSDAEFIRFLRIARASNDELSAQIAMLSAIAGCDQKHLLAQNGILGRKISALITALRHSG